MSFRHPFPVVPSRQLIGFTTRLNNIPAETDILVTPRLASPRFSLQKRLFGV